MSTLPKPVRGANPADGDRGAGRYLSATEAAHKLDVSEATLYAYVSRGLIVSEPAPDGSRQRRYRAEDIDRLNERKDMRRNPEKVAERALFQGSPVLASALTQLDEEDHYYRGYSALELAKASLPIEAVAFVLWLDCDLKVAPTEAQRTFARAVELPGTIARTDPVWKRLSTLERFSVLLPLAQATDPTAHDLRPSAVATTGARILRLLLATATDTMRPSVSAAESIAAVLQRAWAPASPKVAPLIDAALVLCADHELDAASLAACVAASTGATPYAAVNAGLAAAGGIAHLGGCVQAEALVQELGSLHRGTLAAMRALVEDRLKRREGFPRFGHPIYPKGDPRCRVLLEMTQQVRPGSALVRRVKNFSHAVDELAGLRPRVDIALATLAQEFSFPKGAATTLFALARAIGWIAHAIEQYETGRIIRPRARYTGNPKKPLVGFPD